jgi:imidazolonepropionase-like amidohydrolase
LVKGNRISKLGKKSEIDVPDDAEIVDAPGEFLIPGLIDSHIHLAGVIDETQPNFEFTYLQTPSPLLTLYAANHAKACLDAGFTTVRDLSGYANPANIEVVSLRKAIARGLVVGPRILVAGWVGMTAGHLDMGTISTWPRIPRYEADGESEIRRRVREFVRGGVDLIKTASSGGLAGELEQVWWRNYTPQEISVLVDESHSLGRKVAMHAYTSEAVRVSVNAGVDTIEHGTFLNDEVRRMMVEHGVFLIPTLQIFSKRFAEAWNKQVPWAVDKISSGAEVAPSNFRKAVEAGVKIAMGTDIYDILPPAPQPGESAYELELMVEWGMTPMQALISATKNAAEALGIEKDVGVISKGKIADLLLLKQDPLKDITTLQNLNNIERVILAGKTIVDRSQ